MIVFASHSGTTRKVAQRIAARLDDREVVDLSRGEIARTLRPDDCLVLLCPSYGDEEHEDDFEDFLYRDDGCFVSGARFAFCELGIYTGYEEFGHGLAPTVYQALAAHGLTELVPPLSLDSVPVTDWEMVDAWADLIRDRREHARV